MNELENLLRLSESNMVQDVIASRSFLKFFTMLTKAHIQTHNLRDYSVYRKQAVEEHLPDVIGAIVLDYEDEYENFVTNPSVKEFFLYQQGFFLETDYFTSENIQQMLEMIGNEKENTCPGNTCSDVIKKEKKRKKH